MPCPQWRSIDCLPRLPFLSFPRTGLTVAPCADSGELTKLLHSALQLRVVGSHKVNDRCACCCAPLKTPEAVRARHAVYPCACWVARVLCFLCGEPPGAVSRPRVVPVDTVFVVLRTRRSSRSHCMVTVHVTSKPSSDGLAATSTAGGTGAGSFRSHSFGAGSDADDEGEPTLFGKITFVDLAGSERLSQSESEGAMRSESGSINRSLFALGKVRWAAGGRRPCTGDDHQQGRGPGLLTRPTAVWVNVWCWRRCF
jgi:hypothetical protein